MPQPISSRRPRETASSDDETPAARALALEDAYREHAAAVFGLARRLLADRSLAEEVSQEVFLRLWRRPERYDPARGTMRSFLLAECHGRSVDAIRSDTARRRREQCDGRADERRPDPDVATLVCETAVHDRVADLVQALPDGERAAISLAYCSQVTYREVAQILDTPEGTVKGRIRSGLHRLRSQMGELGITAP